MTNLPRRNISMALALGGWLRAGQALASNDGFGTEVQPEVLRFSPNGWIPNNQRLAVLVYRNAIPVSGQDPAASFEKCLLKTAGRRDGVTAFTIYIISTQRRMKCLAFRAEAHE